MQVTCFSDSEEDAVGKSDVVPFKPETRLRELGGLYEKVCFPTKYNCPVSHKATCCTRMIAWNPWKASYCLYSWD